MPRSRMVAAGAALLTFALPACDSGRSTARAAGPPPPAVAWTALHNPIYADAMHAVKDPALVVLAGEWILLFSQVDHAGAWRIGVTRSHDLTSWTAPITLPTDPATGGEASPDVVRAPDGSFIVTYQSFPHDRGGSAAKLYARTTRDFRTFSEPVRLLANLHAGPGERLIDAALAFSPAGLLLGYKLGGTANGDQQHFEIARSTTGTLAGPWQLVGRPHISVYGDTIENYEFLPVDGGWDLIATSNMFDRPQLFTLRGEPRDPRGWLGWSPARELRVPQEPWNPGTGLTGVTYEHANCAYLVDHRAVDHSLYLVYGDTPELKTFGGAGHDVFAIARSTDLVHWSVPPA